MTPLQDLQCALEGYLERGYNRHVTRPEVETEVRGILDNWRLVWGYEKGVRVVWVLRNGILRGDLEFDDPRDPFLMDNTFDQTGISQIPRDLPISSVQIDYLAGLQGIIK